MKKIHSHWGLFEQWNSLPERRRVAISVKNKLATLFSKSYYSFSEGHSLANVCRALDMIVVMSSYTGGRMFPSFLDSVCRRKLMFPLNIFLVLSALCCAKCLCLHLMVCSFSLSLACFKKLLSSQCKIGWDSLVISRLLSWMDFRVSWWR